MLRRRAARIASDLPSMQRLAARYPARATHSTDLPYRLTAHGTVDELDALLWEDERGALAGWAIWVPGWWGVDCAVDPAHAAALYPEVLAWGDDRAAAFARGRAEPTPHWWMYARDDDPDRIAALDAGGFKSADWHNVHFERRLAEEPPAPAVPDGFVLRPLGGEAEVPAYVAAHRVAFDSTYMNEAWRLRTLRAPGYRPELDLVVAGPDGRVAAFAIVWLGPAGEGQFEPVGTHPAFSRLGLGRALLLEGMRRLRAAGATHAVVETDTGRVGARALYTSVMEQSRHTTLPYMKEL
jgi:mycothiol synthase